MRGSRFYRALLRCYPAPFRQEYGGQMQMDFADQLAQARGRGGRRAQAFLWLRAIVDALKVAPGEHWHVLAQDLRYARRALTARPGFTATAVLSLALGIGANAAIFNLWHHILHAPLPAVHEPGTLVMLSNPHASGSLTGGWDPRTDGPRAWLTYAEFEQLRDHADRFSSLMASQSSLSTFQVRFERGGWEEGRGRLVSGEFFDVLGVKPAAGRLFTAADDRVDASHVVISHAYWRRRFGGLPVLGKQMQVRNATATIVGVAPAGFIGETSGQLPDFWLPIRMQPRVMPGVDRLHDTPPTKSMWLHVFGRLKPGVSGAEAEAQANAVFQAGLESFYGASPRRDGAADFREERLTLQSAARGASVARREFSDSLTALLVAVGVLLLIACANIANLLLARGESRRAEMALRLSLGASQLRLIRQLVTESAVLAGAGAVASIAVAYALHGVLVRMLSRFSPSFELHFTPDLPSLAFLASAIVTSGLLTGLLPAWQLTRSAPVEGLRGHSRGSVGGRTELRTGRWLVGLQLALSLPLLVGAGLLARTAYNLQHADLGYAAERLLLLRVDLTGMEASAGEPGVLRQLLRERLREVPGVRSVSYSQLGLFTGGFSNRAIEVEGHTPSTDPDPESTVDVVGPNYFATLGVPLLGRDLLETDRGNAPLVCVVNEAFARQFFKGRQPIGLHVTVVGDEGRTPYQVVGVARDAHTDDVRGSVEPRFYVSAEQPPNSSRSPTFLIRTAGDSPALVAAARASVREVNEAMLIMSAKSIQERLAPLTAQDKTTAQLSLAFAAVSLVLAAIGLYGVLSYGVARRTGEIAVRMALGAEARRVMSMILRETLSVFTTGMLAGAVLAYAASRLIGSRLFGVAPQDPLTLLLATALLLAVALSAALLPARRASRIDPMAALRQE